MITSTPNQQITNLADQYGLPLFVREGDSGIGPDWNYGMAKCHSRFITIAHQDDIYEPGYVENVIKAARNNPDSLIFFTDYGEIRNGIKIHKSCLLTIKRLMLMPFLLKGGQSDKWVRRMVLAFGNPICCPSVTYDMKRLSLPVFEENYGSNLDWQAWERISSLEGRFVYLKKALMYHRIHEASTTSELIHDHERGKEDVAMLMKFWPKPVAFLIGKIYGLSEHLNK